MFLERLFHVPEIRDCNKGGGAGRGAEAAAEGAVRGWRCWKSGLRRGSAGSTTARQGVGWRIYIFFFLRDLRELVVCFFVFFFFLRKQTHKIKQKRDHCNFLFYFILEGES